MLARVKLAPYRRWLPRPPTTPSGGRGGDPVMHKSTMAKVGAVILGAALVGAACGSDNSSSSSGGAATTKAGATTTAAPSSGATTTTTAAGGGGGAGAVAMPTGAKCSGLALGFFGAYTGD